MGDPKREYAREMRKHPTSSERALWRRLRNRKVLGCKFRRQVPIGSYIVDFLCFEPKIIIELDGSGHDHQRGYDTAREAWLESQGFRVLRFGSVIPICDGEELLEILIQEIRSLISSESSE